MAKYRKLPVEIEAFQIGVDEVPPWFTKAVADGIVYFEITCLELIETQICKIKTLEGIMTAYKKDFIIKGVEGEIYACKPDIFKKTYELV